MGMGRLALALAVAALLTAGGALAAPAPQPEESSKAEGVWALPAPKPWDSGAVGASAGAVSLDRPLNLTRRGKPGETRRYRLLRENLNLDRHGRVVGRMVTEATFRRELTREVAPGLWAERVVWERFAYAMTTTPTETPKPQEVPAARGIAYDFDLRSFDYVNPPGDFGRLGDPLVAYMMKVAAMDAMTFDPILRPLAARGAKGPRIGDTHRGEAWREGQRIGEAQGKEVTGSYRLGQSWTTVAGVTRCGGHPCALLWFSAEGNTVKQDMGTGPMVVRMEGTEYFRGTLSASLKDGHVVAGELWGPLPMVMEVGTNGQPPAPVPVAAVLQQVSMRELGSPTPQPRSSSKSSTSKPRAR